MKNLQKAMVEYNCATSSRTAADNINSFRMKGTVIKVNYSKYNRIDLRRNNKTENSIFYNDVFIPMKNDHRFVNEKFQKKINISRKVMVNLGGVNNPDREKLTVMFQKLGKVNKIEFDIDMNNYKIEVEFSKLENGIMTVA